MKFLKKNSALLILLAVGLLTFIVSSPVSYASSASWQQDKSGWWYERADGTYPANQWETINGVWYHFDARGYMQTGWIQLNGTWYYLSGSGAMQTGWVQLNGTWYYLDSSGAMLTGWQLIHGYWYYLNTDGAMLTGWQLISGKWYYMSLTGHWIDNNTYEAGSIKGVDVSKWQGTVNWKSLKNSGISFAMVRVGYGSRNKDGSQSYGLDSRFKTNIAGVASAGIPVGVYYYSIANNDLQSVKDAQFVIQQLQGSTISYPVAIDLEDSTQEKLGKTVITDIAVAFCDEIRAAGYTPMIYCNENWAKRYIDWSRLDGVERWIARYNYLYNRTDYPRGIWQSSSTTKLPGINGNVDSDFAFRDYAALITPRKYSDSGYTPSTGLWRQSVDGRYWYAYLNGGYPAGQWEAVHGTWYYFDVNGYMTTGWQYINGAWYYLNSSGAMTTGWQYINGAWYYLNSSGAMTTGWQYINGNWYYMNASGVMQTGWYTVGSLYYYSNPSGVMLASQYVDGYQLDADGAWRNPYRASWYQNSTGWWYGDNSGWYAKNGTYCINGVNYSFNSFGYLQ